MFSSVSRWLGLPAPAARNVRRESDLLVPMSDGVSLLADRWVPRDSVNPPLLLVRSPYGRRGLVGLLYGRYFARQGFQIVVQSCRGTARSGGDFTRPFAMERSDGADTVKWLLNQPWYPGSFATIGGSYLGYTQLALAEAAAGHLAAAVIQCAPTSVYDIAWPDGSLALNTALGWSAQVHAGPDRALRNSVTQQRLMRRVRDAGMHAPLLETYRTVTGDDLPFFEEWLSHPEAHDAFWSDTDQSSALDHFDCPVLIQAGWYDTFLESSIDQYRRLSARGVTVELSIGPWTHATFGTKGLPQTLGEATTFLHRAVGSRPVSAPAPIRLAGIGTDGIVHLPSWPPSAGHQRVWHLAAGGRLTDSSPDGAVSTRFSYDPADPTPHVGGATIDLAGGPRDNRTVEKREDVITFDTPPLATDFDVIGSPMVELYFGSDRRATCVFLRLCLVTPQGASTNITDRLVALKAPARMPDGARHVVTTLPPTFVRVPVGGRIRLQVSSGAYPRYMRHPGTDQPIATATRFFRAEQVIHHSAARPATLTLPLQDSP